MPLEQYMQKRERKGFKKIPFSLNPFQTFYFLVLIAQLKKAMWWKLIQSFLRNNDGEENVNCFSLTEVDSITKIR